ncbi:MAG: protein-L-isoaspartate O-methyltransferase [Parvularculaceae bacterium]|nr:protein-L-isoaspartate O-methyltransferase [Parvularculaceae bacterium]
MDYAAARKHMVDSQVRPNDVTDLALQTALETVPREAFLPDRLKEQAYVERELVYAPGRRLLTPRDFAKLVAAAEIVLGHSVLDVAAGCGYSSAILARLGASVVAVEQDAALAAAARAALLKVGVSGVEVIEGPPAEGAKAKGPFDVILFAAAVEREPAGLLAQLKDGGRLAVIRRQDGVSRGVVYTRKGESTASRYAFDASTSVIFPGMEAPRAFAF